MAEKIVLPNIICPQDCSVCVPLSKAACQQCMILVDVLGSPVQKKRLAELGLSRGSEVRVIQNHGGPLIVAVKENARMAIGRKMAHNILVQSRTEQTI